MRSRGNVFAGAFLFTVSINWNEDLRDLSIFPFCHFHCEVTFDSISFLISWEVFLSSMFLDFQLSLSAMITCLPNTLQFDANHLILFGTRKERNKKH